MRPEARPTGDGARAASSVRRGPHLWLAPPFDAAPTGGTLYGAALVAALRKRGVDCRRVDIEAAIGALVRGEDGVYWIDTLVLDRVPDLRRANARGRPLAIVAHYLPAIVAHGDGVRREQLSATERDALAGADALLATSATMARLLAGLGAGRPIAVVEPGVEVGPAMPALSDPPRALVLANVTEGKGVLGLLREIALRAAARDRFVLHVVGSLDRERAYADSCRELVARAPVLRDRVRFAGVLSHAAAMAELARADLLVSASRVESYGMALAEARAAGVPMLTRAGGHAAAHVNVETGGELAVDERDLAARLLALVRDPAELSRRKALAIEHRVARSWDEAAHDFERVVIELKLG